MRQPLPTHTPNSPSLVNERWAARLLNTCGGFRRWQAAQRHSQAMVTSIAKWPQLVPLLTLPQAPITQKKKEHKTIKLLTSQELWHVPKQTAYVARTDREAPKGAETTSIYIYMRFMNGAVVTPYGMPIEVGNSMYFQF